jgi:hypothetical protein
MLKGSAKIDVPVYSDDPGDIEQGMDPVKHGIEVLPEDLEQDPRNPAIYRSRRDDPSVEITVTVAADGSTTIATDPSSDVVENSLHA